VNFASLPGLAVLNPGGRDPDQSFRDGPGAPEATAHPPVNYHAYAACTHGAFFRDANEAAKHRSVLLLLRGNLREARRAFEVLRAHGCFVAVSLKESGAHQVAARLAEAGVMATFQSIAAGADLCLSSTPELVPLYQTASRKVVFVPTPYPVESPAWSFARPLSERRGVFIGTREFAVSSRNHLLALAGARLLAAPVTVVNGEGRTGIRRLQSLRYPVDQLNVVSPLSYPDYLRLMAQHQIVFQFDHSAVPGQVAGDSLLCDVPAVGGNGAIERLAYPELNGHGRSLPELVEIARRLLNDSASYRRQVDLLKENAHSRVGFIAVRKQLERFFPGLV
jgi:hypothetical protein